MALTPAQEEKLVEVFQHQESERLSQWERERLAEWANEYEAKGALFWLSQKQWAIIQRIDEKIHGY